MKKKNKFLLPTTLVVSTLVPLAVVVACGGGEGGSSSTSSGWKDSKDIIVSVDGAQKTMWDEVISQFNKTSFHKNDGYNIKTINKDVFGAIDMVQTVGYTDANVGDLIYMPQDRMTSMLQQKALMPWKEEQVNSMLDYIKATSEEKKIVKDFGSTLFRDKKTFFGLAHNKEAIVLATTQDLSSKVRQDVDQGMLTLQNNAEGLFRLQDLWYGSALFNRLVDKDKGKIATDFILYGDKSNWNSGFIKDNKYHSEFKKISDSMADMWFEPLLKAYHENAGQKFIGQKWMDNGINSSDLQNFFNSDVNAVNNFLIDQVSSKKLNYMYAGTWDAQNIAARGIKTLLNPSDKLSVSSPDNTFVQASGTWSFGINARNNGANPKRIAAIMQLIKNIYSKEAFAAYYKNDSKIPYFEKAQDDVKDVVKGEETKQKTIAAQLYDNTTFSRAVGTTSDIKANPKKIKVGLTEQNEKIRELARWFNAYSQQFNSLRDYEVQTEWEGTKNNYMSPTIPSSLPPTTNELYDNISAPNKPYLDTIGVKNMLDKLLNLSTGSDWKIPISSLKKFDDDTLSRIKEGSTDVHVRKIAKELLGFNKDNNDETNKFKDQFVIDAKGVKNIADFKKKVNDAKAKFNKVSNAIEIKGKAFVDKFRKNGTITDAEIKETIKQYLNNMWNAVLRDAQFEYLKQNSINNIKFGDKVYSDVQKTIADAAKTLTLGKIFEVISSTDPTSELGKFRTQSGRFDRINPQFGAVWQLWNEQTFGSKEFLTSSINDIYNNVSLSTKDQKENAFKEKVEDQLDKLFKGKVQQLEAANATGRVKLD